MWGGTCGSLLCPPDPPWDTTASGNISTGILGSAFLAAAAAQLQRSSQQAPGHGAFVNCPELMSTQRAPVTVPALPSTHTLLLLRKFPCPRWFSTSLPQPGFSL